MSQKKQKQAAYQKTLITPAVLQKALLDARSTLDDQAIFLSAAYQKQLNSLGAYLVGRTGRKDIRIQAQVIWDTSPLAVTAYTDNTKVVINAAYPNIQKLPRRSDRNYCVMGMANHEFAHCIFTDFTLLKEQWKAFMAGKIYPIHYRTTPQNEAGIKALQAALDKGKASRRSIASLYKSLDNTLEDAYIERSIVLLHPGDTKKSLRILNQAFFGDDFMEHFKENPEDVKMKWTVFSNALLTLLKMGSVNIDPAFSPEMADIHARISKLAPRVNREVENSNALARKQLALDIITENWDLIEEQMEKEAESLTDEELSSLLDQIISSILAGIGSDHQKHSDNNAGRPIKVFTELPSADNESAGESEESGNAGSDMEGDGDSESKSSVIQISPQTSEGEDGTFGKLLNSIENQLAHGTAQEKVENQLKETLQQNANESSTEDEYSIEIQRSPSIPESGIARYEYIWPKISPISKTLKKELLKILRDRRQGTKQTGLIYGRRLDTRSLYRTDEKYFTKNRLPNDRPQVATALLIDQSGSMERTATDRSGLGLFTNKIQAASNAALLLYDFCVDLGFPIMVAGHTTGFEKSVTMEVMSPFQKVDKDDQYRICAARALGGNRDGTALNYMLSELKQRPEELKLLFIVSDGLPSDYNSESEGVQHLKAVMEDARKSGVMVFAAALDEDIPHLREIYGENMFEITDLARMPRTLLNVMKRFIK